MAVPKRARDVITKAVIDQVAVPWMKRVAQRCDEMDGTEGGYRAGTEGGKALDKRDYRATVITVTAEAARKNLKHDTLLRALGSTPLR